MAPDKPTEASSIDASSDAAALASQRGSASEALAPRSPTRRKSTVRVSVTLDGLLPEACQSAVAHVRVGTKECCGIWCEILGQFLLLVHHSTVHGLEPDELAKTARVTFPQGNPPDLASSPRSRKPPPKLVVSLAPKLFYLEAAEHHFACIALTTEDEHTLTRSRSPLTLNKIGVEATFPPTDKMLAISHCPSDSTPPQESMLLLAKRIDGSTFGAKPKSGKAHLPEKAVLGAPIFEFKEATGLRTLAGFVREVDRRVGEVKMTTANRLVKLVEARVAMELFKALAETLTRTADLTWSKVSWPEEDGLREGGALARQCLVIRRCAAQEDGVARAELLAHGCAQMICSAMGRYSNSAAMQEQGCAVLRNLAVGQDFAEALVAAKAPVLICRAMQDRLKSGAVQEQGCGALSNIACCDEGKLAVAKAEGLNAIVGAMDAHENDKGVQLQAIGALWNLGVNHAVNRQCIAKAGAIRRIVMSIGKHGKDATLQATACAALGNLVSQCPEGKDAAAAAKAAEQVVEVMGGHRGSVDVQRHACNALWSLTANHAENQVAAGQADAVPNVGLILQHFVESPELLESALGALRSLTAQNDANKGRCFLSGAFDGIFQVMKLFPAHEGVQRQACGVLWNMAAGGKNVKSSMAAQDNLERIFDAITMHSASAPVLENACGALRNLVADNSEGIPDLLRAGVAKHLVIAMGGLPKDIPLQRQCLEAFLRICQLGNSCCEEVVKQGGVPMICAAMSTHPGDAVIQERGCHILRWLSDIRLGTRDAVVQAGGVDCIVAALRNHQRSSVVVLRSCEALVNLCNGGDSERDDHFHVVVDEPLVRMVVIKEGVEFACRAMRSHQNNVAPLEVACRLLQHLCLQHSECVAAQNFGAMDDAVNALKLFPGHSTLFVSVCALLKALVFVDGVALNEFTAEGGGLGVVAAEMETLADDMPAQLAGLEVLSELVSTDSVEYTAVHAALDAGAMHFAAGAIAVHYQTEALCLAASKLLHRALLLGTKERNVGLEIGALGLVRHIVEVHKSSVGVLEHGVPALLLLERATAAKSTFNASTAQPPARKDLDEEALGALATAACANAFMTAQINNEGVQISGCALLRELCALYPRAFYERDVVRPIHFEDGSMSAKSGRRSSGMSPAGSARAKATSPKSAKEQELDGYPTCKDFANLLTNALASFPQSEPVSKQACSAIWTMVKDNPGGKTAAVEAGIMPHLAKLFRKFKTSALVHRQLLAAVWGLVSRSRLGKDAAYEARILPLVVKVLEDDIDDEVVQERACGVLACLINEHENNQRSALEAKLGERVLSVMMYTLSEAVLHQGASVIANFCADCRPGRLEVVNAKAADFLCQVLNDYPENRKLHRKVFAALWNLAIEDNFTKGVILQNSLPGIVTSMQDAAEDALLQRHGLELLQCMAHGAADHQTKIMANEGIEVIANAMKNHPSKIEVQRVAACALGTLVFRHKQAKKRANATGCIELLKDALENHFYNAPLAEAVIWAIGNLSADNVSNQHAFAKADIFSPINKAIRQHLSGTGIQSVASATLRRLEKCEERESEADSDQQRAMANKRSPMFQMKRIGQKAFLQNATFKSSASRTRALEPAKVSRMFCFCCRGHSKDDEDVVA